MNNYCHFALSNQGHNHIKSGKVCQDSSGSYADDLMTIIALADGHGSDDYPRTDRGSGFAVERAINAIKEFVIASQSIPSFTPSEDQLSRLAGNILMGWNDDVVEDLKREPLTDPDLEKVSEKYRERYKNFSEQYGSKAYGTTLIAICITNTYWFGLQIGDGKCASFGEDGVTAEPIPWDESCHNNITTSICDDNAIDEFRFCYGDRESIPAAVFISSDGLDDSYPAPAMPKVIRFYKSILQIAEKTDEQTMQDELKPYLDKISRKGSGDDISVCGCFNRELLRNTVIEAHKRELKNLTQELESHEFAIRKADSILTTRQKLTNQLNDKEKTLNELKQKESDSEQRRSEEKRKSKHCFYRVINCYYCVFIWFRNLFSHNAQNTAGSSYAEEIIRVEREIKEIKGRIEEMNTDVMKAKHIQEKANEVRERISAIEQELKTYGQ